MKVAIFTRFPHDPASPRGGVEAVTLALVPALAALPDTEVHVITLERELHDPARESALGATIHRLPAPRWPQMFDVVGGPGRRRLKRFLAKLKPDIVHFHETYGLCIGQLPMPHVFTVHGFDHANIPTEQRSMSWLRAPLWKCVEGWGLARHRHIISITPYVREHIESLTDAQIYDIDNPISASCFEVERQEVPGRVFFAGWITRRKNPVGLVRAFAKVIEAGTEARLRIAGEESDPPYAELLRRTIHDLRLEERVTLLGRVSPDRIRQELSQASIFALPSLQENAPMAISESLAAGVPVVSSNVCGMPFMIDEGRTGYLTDPEDTDSIAARIGELLRDDALRARMGAAARESAWKRFHPDSVACKTRSVYEAILSGDAYTPSPILAESVGQ